MSQTDAKPRNFWPVRIATGIFILTLIGGMSLAQVRSREQSKRDLENRFALRADTATTFLDAYVTTTLEREKRLAELRLGDPTVSHDQFLDFLDDFEFGPSMLLDENGILLDIAPFKSDLIGTKVTADYTHLQMAVNGQASVSNVVPSAALQYPVVAFATPFESQVGTRIISGAFDLTTQPLGNYLRNALPYQDKGAVYLIDESNKVIVSSSDDPNTTQNMDDSTNVNTTKTIQEVDKGFVSIGHSNKRGSFLSHGKVDSYFASQQIKGTPWRIVMSVQNNALYAPISGASNILPWIYITSFSIVAIILVVILVRDRERRLRLQDTALIDLLTGIYNPRGIKSHLSRLLSSSRRHETDLSVFIIDIDNFSDINERYGHNRGDEVLVDIASQLQTKLRAEDIAGRWSGEEFVVVLPNTDIQGAFIVADRFRHLITEEVHVPNNDETVSVSIGLANYAKDDTLESITSRCYDALKEAKESGKNQVVAQDA